MRSDVKEAWAKELRSGDHRQGIGRLCEGGEKCCLGVLALVTERDFPEILNELEVEVRGDWNYGVEMRSAGGGRYDGVLPTELWQALDTKNTQHDYYTMNDDKRWGFDRIATAIEETE